MGERQTEDLKALCSIHSRGIFVFLNFSIRRYSGREFIVHRTPSRPFRQKTLLSTPISILLAAYWTYCISLFNGETRSVKCFKSPIIHHALTDITQCSSSSNDDDDDDYEYNYDITDIIIFQHQKYLYSKFYQMVIQYNMVVLYCIGNIQVVYFLTTPLLHYWAAQLWLNNNTWKRGTNTYVTNSSTVQCMNS